MHAPLDPFDPNVWPLLTPAHEFRIYLDDRAETFAIVDEIIAAAPIFVMRRTR